MTAFVLKVIFGIGLWYIYTYYYNYGDLHAYFHDSKILFDALFIHPVDFIKMFFGLDNDRYFQDQYYSKMFLWSPRFDHFINIESHTMTKVNVVFRFFSLGFSHVHTVFINMLSFTGLVGLYKSVEKFAKGKSNYLFVAIFLAPVVLFWGSGLLKESFILFPLGCSVYVGARFIQDERNLKKLLLLFLLLVLLFLCKMVLSLIVVLALVAWYASLRLNYWHASINFILVALIAFSSITVLALFTPYNYFKVLVTKQVDFINMTNGGLYIINNNKMVYIPFEKREQLLEQVGKSSYKVRKGSDYYYYNMPNSADTSYVYNSTDTLTYKLFSQSVPSNTNIHIPLLSPDPLSFIKNAPSALITVFVRPSIFEAKNPLVLLAAIDNAIIFLLVLFVLIYIDKKVLKEPSLWFCLFIVVCFYILVGWVTPSLGAMVRYKSVVYPFLLIALVLLYGPDKKESKKTN